MINMTKGEKIFNIFNMALLLALAFSTLYPFLYTLSMSLSTPSEAVKEGLHIFPGDVTFAAYKIVFSSPFLAVGYANTLFRTLVGTFLTLVFTCLCAYPLSQKEMPHRRVFIFLTVFTMMFSGGLIPTFLLIKNLGLLDSLLVYIIPMLVSAFNVILVKNFFESIPQSFRESAYMDGANDFQILFKIYIPLSKPVLATVALITAIAHWNSWFDALIYVNDENKQVMMSFLRRIIVEGNTAMMSQQQMSESMVSFTPDTVKAAIVIVTILPILCIYPFMQKHFVKGIMLGGVKE